MNMSIKQKQWQLKYLAFYPGNIDGLWGPQSKAATEKFQRAYGLDIDGIFGTNTTAKSIEVIKEIQKIIGADMDGLAGPNTMNATKAWQASHGLSADGIAGPLTRAKIKEVTEDADGSWWDSIKYFDRSEFKCKCKGKYCNGYPVEPKKLLVQNADKVRRHFGAPAIISSGVRCEVHNANVGGVSNSRHRFGKAMDFRIEGKTSTETLSYVKTLSDIRYAYAIDENYVHMDVE